MSILKNIITNTISGVLSVAIIYGYHQLESLFEEHKYMKEELKTAKTELENVLKENDALENQLKEIIERRPEIIERRPFFFSKKVTSTFSPLFSLILAEDQKEKKKGTLPLFPS